MCLNLQAKVANPAILAQKYDTLQDVLVWNSPMLLDSIKNNFWTKILTKQMLFQCTSLDKLKSHVYP